MNALQLARKPIPGTALSRTNPLPPDTERLRAHPRVVIGGELDGAARRLATLLSEAPLQPMWNHLFSGRVDCGHLDLPGIGNVGLFLADDNHGLVRSAASIDATHLVMCYSAARLETPETRDTMGRLAAAEPSLSVAVVVIGIPQPQADRRFLRWLQSRGGHWPVYRVLANDLVAVRQVARLVIG